MNRLGKSVETNKLRHNPHTCLEGGTNRSLLSQPSLDDADKVGMAFDAPQIESIRDAYSPFGWTCPGGEGVTSFLNFFKLVSLFQRPCAAAG